MENPLNPLTFVGPVDGRSALLAVLLALPWIVLLARGATRRWTTWAAVAAGVVLFPLSLAWLQAPIELGLLWLWTRLLGAPAAEGYLLAVAVPLVLVAGPVQEGIKLAATVAGLRWRRAVGSPLAGLRMGAAVGAGYGAMEAFWVLNILSAPGWTWGVAGAQGLAAPVVIVERLFAVAFHAGAGAVAGYGYGVGRPWRHLLIAIALHGAMNLGDVLRQVGLKGAVALEVWVALLSAATVGLALWQRRRAVAEGHERAASSGAPA